MSVRVADLAAIAIVTTLAAACSSSTAPKGNSAPPPNGIEFVAGNQQSDTIQSVLNQALVVQVNQSGAAVPNQIVQFQAISADTTTFPNVGDWCDPVALTSNQPVSFIADSTNAQGQASVGIALGLRAGKARLIVKVPALGYVDTATFTVTAGGPAALQGGPADTAVYANATVKLHSTVVDRIGNPRSDTVTYSVLSGPATISGSSVTVTAIGRVLVAGRAGTAQDTSYISGVPTGTIAASDDSGGVVVFNLDGSGYKKITTSFAGVVAWAPNGASVAFDQTTGGGTGGGNSSLFSATVPGGSISTLDNSGGPIDAWPAYSRDGSWIYYVKITNSPDIWRVHPDGSGDALLSTQATTSAQFPSPSPDGTQLVYVIPGAANVEIVTLATGAQTQLGNVLAISTAWSPASNVIAYVGGGSIIAVVNSDGTGGVTLTSTPYQPAIAWSPDGKWIIARNQNTNKLDLISATTPNMILPVGFTGSVGSPSWH